MRLKDSRTFLLSARTNAHSSCSTVCIAESSTNSPAVNSTTSTLSTCLVVNAANVHLALHCSFKLLRIRKYGKIRPMFSVRLYTAQFMLPCHSGRRVREDAHWDRRRTSPAFAYHAQPGDLTAAGRCSRIETFIQDRLAMPCKVVASPSTEQRESIVLCGEKCSANTRLCFFAEFFRCSLKAAKIRPRFPPRIPEFKRVRSKPKELTPSIVSLIGILDGEVVANVSASGPTAFRWRSAQPARSGVGRDRTCQTIGHTPCGIKTWESIVREQFRNP